MGRLDLMREQTTGPRSRAVAAINSNTVQALQLTHDLLPI
jgi:hypothetical protein